VHPEPGFRRFHCGTAGKNAALGDVSVPARSPGRHWSHNEAPPATVARLAATDEYRQYRAKLEKDIRLIPVGSKHPRGLPPRRASRLHSRWAHHRRASAPAFVRKDRQGLGGSTICPSPCWRKFLTLIVGCKNHPSMAGCECFGTCKARRRRAGRCGASGTVGGQCPRIGEYPSPRSSMAVLTVSCGIDLDVSRARPALLGILRGDRRMALRCAQEPSS
jgi:hypothetical protein